MTPNPQVNRGGDARAEESRHALASRFRDWVHGSPLSECNASVDTCPDWPLAYELADLAMPLLAQEREKVERAYKARDNAERSFQSAEAALGEAETAGVRIAQLEQEAVARAEAAESLLGEATRALQAIIAQLDEAWAEATHGKTANPEVIDGLVSVARDIARAALDTSHQEDTGA